MAGRPPIPPARLATMIHPRERTYLILVVLASVITYLYLGVTLLGLAVMGSELSKVASSAAPTSAATTPAMPGARQILSYVCLFVLVYLVAYGHMVGRLRGNGVRVTERQFPAVHRLVQRHAAALSLDPVPPVYIIQQGGLLNAFAVRFFSRSFVVLYSDIVALAHDRGEDALGFVVAHELAHIKRGHLRHRWVKVPGLFVPYLGKAYSRACEYTCDRFAAECGPEGAIRGLLVLAAGRSLYRDMDASLFAEQVSTETGFWVRRAEIASTHPFLPKRVAALMSAGIPAPVNYG